jgi:hypothetical protein
MGNEHTHVADLEETSPRFPSDNTVPRQVAMALRGFDDHSPRSTIHAGELCADVPPQPLCFVHSVVVVEAAEEATNLPTEKGNSRRRCQSRCHALCSLLVQFYRLWSSISALPVFRSELGSYRVAARYSVPVRTL